MEVVTDMPRALETFTRNRSPLSRKLVQRLSLLFSLLLIILLSANTALPAQTTLAWDPPVNVDGTPFTGHSGYKIHMGNASGSYTQHFDVGNTTSYALNNLSDGSTYYFVVTDYDNAGNESGFSNEVSRTFAAVSTTPTPVSYVISATSGTGGTISPQGNVSVNQASNQTSTIKTVTAAKGTSVSFSVSANQGYQISNVVVDGVSVGKISTYTFSSINKDHTITAAFTLPATATTLKGDADNDGVVSLEDALTVLRAVTNNTQLTTDQKSRSDVWPLNASGKPQGDSIVNLNDALLVLRKAVGLTTW
jgi:hypothetical protein